VSSFQNAVACQIRQVVEERLRDHWALERSFRLHVALRSERAGIEEFVLHPHAAASRVRVMPPAVMFLATVGLGLVLGWAATHVSCGSRPPRERPLTGSANAVSGCRGGEGMARAAPSRSPRASRFSL